MTVKAILRAPRWGGTWALLATLAALGAGVAQDALRIAHVSWSSSRASAYVVAEALRVETGLRVELTEMPVAEAWAAVAEGEQDAFLSAWLPDTHAPYWEEHGDALVDLGPSLERTRTGLMVPDIGTSRQTEERGRRGAGTPDVTSIADLAGRADRFGGQIVGIDPGAGVMRQAERALEVYGLEEWELLVTGSEQEMIARLREAIRTQQEIVVTGWVPLWVHGLWSLRFLEDPEGVFGEGDAIHTVVRQGLEEDMPEAVRALDAFAWEVEDMHRVMVWMQQQRIFPRDAARRWLATNPEEVDAWFQ